LLDKPPGITSAGAVAVVKRLLPRKTKIGHTGTLDPLATGLLVLVIGRATRLSRYVTDLDKSYVATARFGAISDTLDAEGEILTLDAPMPDEDDLRSAMQQFTGDITQIPPMASAVKVGGERLYKAHRRGETVERESRPVTIHSFSLTNLDIASQTATFEISCSSGTYVRSLIADLADSLGTGAHLTALRRTSIGDLNLQHATTLDHLTEDSVYNHIIQTNAVVGHLLILGVGGRTEKMVRSGRSLEAAGIEGPYRIMGGDELLAVYRDSGNEARPEVVLCGE